MGKISARGGRRSEVGTLLAELVPNTLGLLGIAVAAWLCAASLRAQTASVAATPPMGWNSWNHFAGKIDDATVRKQADAMVSSGMKDAGYVYVNIDDTWEGQRAPDGEIRTNQKFPDMKALADYVHSKGLKLGIYSSPGPKTCAEYEGSYGHEEQDAATYAKWGIDYLKYDLCSFHEKMKAAGSAEGAHQMMLDAYTKMHQAILKTGRPMVYSLCQYGADHVWEWGPSVGANLWRTTDDISDNYDRMSVIGFQQAGLSKFAAPGHWNDPDMLEVGNGKMKPDEYRSHMALWALLAAPLLAGNDLTTMSRETIAILTNREVIAIDQDKLGKQGERMWAEGSQEIWVRELEGGAKAVGIFNRFDWPQVIEVDWGKLGFKSGAKAHDVWAGKDLGALNPKYSAHVAGHGVLLLRVNE